MLGHTGFTEGFVLMKTEDMTKLLAALDVVRKEHSHISVGMLHAMLTAADLHDVLYAHRAEMSVLAHELGVPYSTFTRQLDTLGEGVAKRGGPGLVEKVLIQGSGKLKVAAVTDRGIALMRAMASAMALARDEAGTASQKRIERLRSRLDAAKAGYQTKP